MKVFTKQFKKSARERFKALGFTLYLVYAFLFPVFALIEGYGSKAISSDFYQASVFWVVYYYIFLILTIKLFK